MAAGRMRSTRRLRKWIVEQVSSGKFPGVVWDDEEKTMFRIPWKHAGKQDFRKDEDAAIFKAWAEFKGKLSDGGGENPASWKTRLRCALNKSPEFSEMMERAQLDISEPYKVYRLVPENEQGLVVPEKKVKVRAMKRPMKRPKTKMKTRKRRRSSDEESSDEDEDEDEDHIQPKIKKEERVEDVLRWTDAQTDDSASNAVIIQGDVVNEIRVDVRIDESFTAPAAAEDSFTVLVHYLGQEVLRRHVQSPDVRIAYLPSSVAPPTPAALGCRFPRIPLPEPPATLSGAAGGPGGPELQALLTLLPFMERGVVLTATPGGVYGKRFCQGRVYWRGPHGGAHTGGAPGPHKMERMTEPVMLFCKETFRQQLEHFRVHGGLPPSCGVTLCFGEELSDSEDPAAKLITVQILFPWAQHQVQTHQSLVESISFLQSLASESPLGEITLNLVSVDPETPI